jgi:hypothetical protein
MREAIRADEGGNQSPTFGNDFSTKCQTAERWSYSSEGSRTPDVALPVLTRTRSMSST